jgi:TolB-like protein
LSNDPDQEYFSDGMMEEILNHLVKLKNLKVTSRTSSMQYKKTAKSLGEIGNELGVKYVLEGSVRKYEDNLRINTKLIDVETDINLWSQSYDSKLTDIFDIQSEIAKSVTSELSMILSPDEIEQIEKKGTKNLKAYNFYLKGRHFFHNRTEKDEELKKSIEYFEKALAIDQQYALVHAGLADANLMLAWRASRRDTLQSAEKSSKAKSHAKKALEIDPNLAEAHAVIGIMTCFFDWQWQEGGKILERAIQFSPNYSTGHQYYSEYLSVLRKTEAARIQINKALDLNPLSSMLYIISSSYYFNEGKLDKSLQEVLRAKDLDSNLPSVYWKLFHIYKEQGLEEKAVEQLKHFFNLDRSLVEHIKFIDDVYTKQGMNGLVKWWMDFEENKKPNNPHYIAMNYAAIGENALALEWLEKSFELGGPDLPSMNNNRMFANFCSDPRFITMLESMGLASEKN